MQSERETVWLFVCYLDTHAEWEGDSDQEEEEGEGSEDVCTQACMVPLSWGMQCEVCMVLSVYCQLCSVWMECSVQCLECNVQCVVCSAKCTVWIVQCAVNSDQLAVCSVPCAMWIIKNAQLTLIYCKCCTNNNPPLLLHYRALQESFLNNSSSYWNAISLGDHISLRRVRGRFLQDANAQTSELTSKVVKVSTKSMAWAVSRICLIVQTL